MHAGTLSAQEATTQNAKRVLSVNSAGQVASSRGDSVKHLAPAMMDDIRDAYTSGNPVTIKRTLAKAANMYDMLAQVSPENAEIFADQVLAQPFGGKQLMVERRDSHTGATVMEPKFDSEGAPVFETVRDEIDKYRNEEEFRNIRREYSAEESYRRGMAGGSAGGTPGTPPGATPTGTP
jgi:hypothetical protein